MPAVASPGIQHRELGETVHLHPAGGLRVSLFEPGRALGLEGWGTFALEPVGQGQNSADRARRCTARPWRSVVVLMEASRIS